MVPTHQQPALHVPVMRERCLELLAPALERPDAVVVDATLGLGGHAEALLLHFPQVTLVGIDRDESALERSRTRLQPYAERCHLVHAVYDDIPEVLADLDIKAVDGLLFDLGVSSMQLDQADRGFSYHADAPLDMRMNQQDRLTAADVVNSYGQGELARILREYGEERFADRIAAAIVKARAISPIRTTSQLVDVVRDAIPAATRRTGGHPAKRSFQAIRIEVNSELSVLSRALPRALALLKPGGRAVVESYQSLEDRIVKQCFAGLTTVQNPLDLPVLPPSAEPDFRLLTRGAEVAGDDEQALNPRAASVRLRAIERRGA